MGATSPGLQKQRGNGKAAPNTRLLSMREDGTGAAITPLCPHTSTPQVGPLRLHAQASQAGSGSWPSSPLEIRLRLAFRGSSGNSSTVVSVWVLSSDTFRFLSSRRVGLCGMSTTPWSVGGSITGGGGGGGSKKYFSAGRSLSSGASKGSCLFPVLYSPV